MKMKLTALALSALALGFLAAAKETSGALLEDKTEDRPQEHVIPYPGSAKDIERLVDCDTGLLFIKIGSPNLGQSSVKHMIDLTEKDQSERTQEARNLCRTAKLTPHF